MFGYIKFNRLILLCLTLSSFFIATYCLPVEKSTTRKRVAFNLPLTGALATYGSAIREGVQFALTEGGTKSLPNIECDWEDNQSQAAKAVSAAKKQLLSSPDIYVSGVKPQYMAIHDIISRTKIPHFLWVFDGVLRPQGEHNFRTWVNFKMEPPLFIEYAKQRRAKRIAIVYVQLPITDEEYMSRIVPGLKKGGISDIQINPYQMDLTDFKSLALRIRTFSPDLLILSGFQENLVNMIPAFYNLGLIQGDNTVFSYDLLDAAPLLPPNMIENVRVTSPGFLLNRNSEPILSWINRFKERFGKEPLYTHAYAYDLMKILMKAAENLPPKPSTEDWIRALEAINMKGITGLLKFDGEGDLLPEVVLAKLQKGEVVEKGPVTLSTKRIGDNKGDRPLFPLRSPLENMG